MRIVSWNILQGGGRRLPEVCAALKGWAPDIAVLQEVRRSSVPDLTKALSLPESYLADTEEARDNAPFIASRDPLEAGDFIENREGLCHILEAETYGLTILPVHFPQKAAQVPLFEALLADSASLLDLDTLLIGDLNCGLPFIDSTDKTFANAKYFQALLDAGWVDLYRQHAGPDARDYSWISPRTGRGFRYDHALASPSLAERLVSLTYDHAPRDSGVSDHSAIVLEVSE